MPLLLFREMEVKMKKIICILLACSVIFGGCGKETDTSTGNDVLEKTVEPSTKNVDVSVISSSNVVHSVSEGLMASYEAMEKQSDLIVYGTKTSEFLKPPSFDGGVYKLMAEFEIESVIKGGKEYKSGDKITVSEDVEYSVDTNIVYHSHGYQRMENGKQYYLMLGNGDSVRQYYIISGVIGKIPVDTKEVNTIDSEELRTEEKERTDKWVKRNRAELVKK